MAIIQNATSKIWDSATLNGVLRQLRQLKGIKIVRDYSAGTVVVTGKSKKTGKVREFLRGLQQGKGGRWIVRFDAKLLQPK